MCSVRAGLTRANGGASSTATAPSSSSSSTSTSSSSSSSSSTSQPRQEPAASRSSSSSGNYTVRSGDTVYKLAQRFGTTVSSIVSANQLANGGRLIYVGDRLSIPGAGPASSSSSSSSSGSYTVKAGDTVSALASRYGTTVSAIAQASNLSNPDFIVVGQKLSIPGA
ncbi:LysM peptidoglycan-binding domain-containing protein [Ornithinimicrobium sp. EGI L100131]|nr:LysM peptidoglycan-binding domain-containing protein [Ornithinimicrobium sediminis]